MKSNVTRFVGVDQAERKDVAGRSAEQLERHDVAHTADRVTARSGDATDSAPERPRWGGPVPSLIAGTNRRRVARAAQYAGPQRSVWVVWSSGDVVSSRDRFQRRARRIQKETGWSYSECLRLSRAEISEPALEVLIKMRKGTLREPHDVPDVE